HGPEDLLLRDAHLRIDTGEDRRREVVATLVSRDRDPLAAGDELRAFLLADLDVPFDGLELCLGNDRPHRAGLVERRTDRDALGFSTTVFPAAIAGAIFHAAITSGKFHGMI